MIDHFLFDLDGTLTNEELLPRIASAIGVESQIQELTELTIAGKIPFEYSLRHRVEIINKAPVSQIRRIVSEVEMNPHILSFIQKNATRCKIVTGNLDAWLIDLIPKIGVPVYTSTVEVINDKISAIKKIINKAEVTNFFSGKVCAIGDGANDVGMLATADMGIAYGGVHSPARPLLEVATHVIYEGETLCRFLSQL